MDQRIFTMELSVEATSLYLLMVALGDGGAPLNRENVAEFWNGAADELDHAFEELTSRQIAGQGAAGDWHLRPGSDWLPPA